jgi:hypothetical protein
LVSRLKAIVKEKTKRNIASKGGSCSCDPGPNGDGGQTVVDHIRLFPLREDVRWTYRVHEQMLPALRRINVPVR